MAKKALRTKPKPVGRPSLYNADIADIIVERMIDGESLLRICADDDMPCRATVYRWYDFHPDFHARCARAREGMADFLVDQIEKMAEDTDESNVQSQKVKIATAQWRAEKMAPRLYGSRTTTELTGPGGGAIQVRATTIDVRQLDADSREAFKQALLSAGKVIEHDNNEGN
jgi:hypothetical protein